MSSSDEDSLLDELREYFSESEWARLPKWEKEGYRNMKRTHLYLISIGQRCPTPAFMSRRRGAISPLGTPTWYLSDSEDGWESSEEEERPKEEEEERTTEKERPEEEDEEKETPSEERTSHGHTHAPSLEKRPEEEEEERHNIERPWRGHSHTHNVERPPLEEEMSPNLERAPLDHSHTHTPDTSDSEDWTPISERLWLSHTHTPSSERPSSGHTHTFSSERLWSGHTHSLTTDIGDSEEWTASLETTPPDHTHSPGTESSHTHTPDTSDSEEWTPISERPWQAPLSIGPPASLSAEHTAGPLRHTPPQVCSTESGRERDGLESLDGQRAREQNATAKTSAVLKREWLTEQKAKLRSCWRGDNLRRKPRVRYSEGERRDDEDFYCEQCGSFFVDECWIHGPPIFIPDTPTPVGVPDRARFTVPPGLEVSRSPIPNAGLGVFNNRGYDIARGTHYGPYEGEIADKDQAIESGYSWVISKSHQEDEYIDANRPTHSNWMRYVNCARGSEEQNLVAFQYRGEIVYRCCRPIGHGEELLVWYGDDYARKLENTFDFLWDVKCGATETSVASQVFSCSLCPFSFTAQIYLQKHMKRSHPDKYVRLLRSGETRSETLFPSPGNRGGNHHTQQPSARDTQHSTVWEFTPDTQPSPEQRRPQTQTTHQHTHTAEKKEHCTDSGKNFSPEQHVKAHQHTPTGERPYYCTHCGKSFAQQGYLRIHQRIHTGERPYHCTQCGKRFTQKGSLKLHQRIHTGERPYHCIYCKKSFTLQGYLRIHQRIHTGERPYHCIQCSKSFMSAGHLKQHQRIHTGERPYHCTQCNKSFTQGVSLRLHQRIHTAERLYHCTQCNKSFTQERSLRLHQRIHTGERLYHCTQCNKSFTQGGSLRIHQRIHTGERPYYCTQCGKSFTRSNDLQRHHRIHNRDRITALSMARVSLEGTINNNTSAYTTERDRITALSVARVLH